MEAFIDFYPFLSIFIPFHRGHKGSLELLKRSETDALFMPNQIVKRFIKKYIDFHQKFAKIEGFKVDHSKKLLNFQNPGFLYRKSCSKFDGFWWLEWTRGGRWRRRLNSGECLRRHHFCSSQGQVAPQAQLEESANDRGKPEVDEVPKLVEFSADTHSRSLFLDDFLVYLRCSAPSTWSKNCSRKKWTNRHTDRQDLVDLELGRDPFPDT